MHVRRKPHQGGRTAAPLLVGLPRRRCGRSGSVLLGCSPSLEFGCGLRCSSGEQAGRGRRFVCWRWMRRRSLSFAWSVGRDLPPGDARIGGVGIARLLVQRRPVWIGRCPQSSLSQKVPEFDPGCEEVSECLRCRTGLSSSGSNPSSTSLALGRGAFGIGQRLPRSEADPRALLLAGIA